MEETVTADPDDNQEMVAINEADMDSGDDKEEEVSKMKLKSSYRQKYKRAWELDQELRGMSLAIYVSHKPIVRQIEIAFEMNAFNSEKWFQIGFNRTLSAN